MFLVILLLTVLFLVFKYFTRSLNIWKIKGVKYLQPLPFFGNSFSSLIQRESIVMATKRMYDSFPGERYGGIFQLQKPVLILRDPDLIKQIGIKDFDKFRDHDSLNVGDGDPLWSKNLFASQGDKWHDLRTTLSPTFTGSKMRSMFVLMKDCADKFVEYFEESEEEVITLEMKDAFARFANDVIATCAFGIQCDSLRERDNEFYRRGLEATDFSGFKGFKLFGFLLAPKLMKMLNIRVFSIPLGNFFKSLIRKTIALREEQGIVRPDMIHILLEASKADTRGVMSTDEDITAQALIFFFAGFDTVSTMISFMSYELAMNPEIQDRLRMELENNLSEFDGNITYDVLMKSKYLDMVVSEAMRKWPPMIVSDRISNAPYTISPKNPGEKSLELEAGSVVWFPQFALQRDPRFFPNPEKFDPERFSDENKHQINSGAYIPFGIGPRNCIGSRFALMEMKIIIATLLTRFEIVPVEKTMNPIVLSPKHFVPYVKGGMWLGLKRRKVD